MEAGMTELDLSRAPQGALAAQTLVATVAEQGDLAERHYLELKSTLDLSTKRAKEKIAKFILGAANRMPDVAATAFEGYGVMIIGVARGAIVGVPPVEMMELAKVVQQFIGAAGPRWDIIWVPIKDSTNQVLLIIVDPPKPGQGPFPCRANGESLTDGRIYVRAEGETREANSAELDLLLQSAMSGSLVEVDFGVEIVGDLASVNYDEAATVNDYIAKVRSRLVGALPKEEAPTPAGASSLAEAYANMPGIASMINSVSAIAAGMMEPEKRTEEEYLDSIDRWEARFRTAWSAALPKITASQVVPAVVKITNRTTTFFHEVEVKLHLEGDVSALDYCDPEWADDFADLDLPAPPRKWGPWQRTFDIPNYAHLSHVIPSLPGTYTPPSVSFRNGGSVDLDLDVGELRPLGSYESEDEELVLIVADKTLTSIHGTWQLTARDHHEVYTGSIDVPVSGDRDITKFSRRLLGLQEPEGS